MNILSEYLDFVKEQVLVQQKLAKKYILPEWRHKIHTDSSKKFAELAETIEKTLSYIKELEKRPNPEKLQIKQSFELSYDEVEGLPEELIKELSISETDKIEHIIKTLIDGAGGILNIDRILIGLYGYTKEVHKRNATTARLYRMCQKGLIYSVPNRKGLYSTIENSNLEPVQNNV